MQEPLSPQALTATATALRTARISLIALAILAAGCADGSAPRQVIVYSPHGEDILRDFERRFEAAHPGYDLVTFDMGANEVRDRLRAESAHPRADVWWGAPASTFMEGAREGLLAPYVPTWASQVDDGWHDAEWRWGGVFKLPIVLGYNREITDPDTLPATWDDVVDARFEGQIVLRHPLASGTMTTLFCSRIYQSMRDTGSTDEGNDWLLALDRNTARYEPNPQAMYDSVARDPAGRWTLWALSDLVYQAQKSTDPIPFGTRTLSGETPVILDCIALVAGGAAPEGAKLFYEFATTSESLLFLAEAHGKIPVRRDVPAAQLPEWMRDTGETPMKVDWQTLADEGPGWMRHWDREIEGRGADGPR